MDQSQLLKTRIINSIELIKYKIRDEDCMPIFNDLTIIRHIVPKLTTNTLRIILREIKKIDKSLNLKEKEGSTSEDSDCFEQISISKIIDALEKEPQKGDGLLRDFLSTCGRGGQPNFMITL